MENSSKFKRVKIINEIDFELLRMKGLQKQNFTDNDCLMIMAEGKYNDVLKIEKKWWQKLWAKKEQKRRDRGETKTVWKQRKEKTIKEGEEWEGGSNNKNN